MKGFFRSTPVQVVLGWVFAAYIGLVYRTTRWEERGREIAQAAWDRTGQDQTEWDGDAGVIACFWHSRILMTPCHWPKDAQPVKALVSLSPDGQFITRVAEHWGIGVVRGSANTKKKAKNKGGLAAFREMVAHVRAGGCVAITPDGPKGPRMRVSPGVIKLAKMTGAPVITFSWSTRRRVVFKSWDRFLLPLPFGRGVMEWRGPFQIDAEDEEGLEAQRLEIERAMIACSQAVEADTDAPVIEPGPPKHAPAHA